MSELVVPGNKKAAKIEGLPVLQCEHHAPHYARQPGRCLLGAHYRITLGDGTVTLRCATHLADFVPEQPFAKEKP